MNVKWEKRRNGYFAYARHSWREEGKVKTANKYLGADIKTATANLREFGRKFNIDNEKIDNLAQSLMIQGQELGVKPDNYTYDNKDFSKRFMQRLNEFTELIIEADTQKRRKELQKEFIQFKAELISYINSAKK